MLEVDADGVPVVEELGGGFEEAGLGKAAGAEVECDLAQPFQRAGELRGAELGKRVKPNLCHRDQHLW